MELRRMAKGQTLGPSFCFPMCIIRELNCKGTSQDLNWQSFGISEQASALPFKIMPDICVSYEMPI